MNVDVIVSDVCGQVSQLSQTEFGSAETALFLKGAKVEEFDSGSVIVDFFEPASFVYFLLKGSVAFWNSDAATHLLAETDDYLMPLGWSSLRRPNRYFSHITAETPVSVLSIDLDVIESLSEQAPDKAMAFHAWVFWHAHKLVMASRAEFPSSSGGAVDLESSKVSGLKEALENCLRHSPLLAGFEQSSLSDLVEQAQTYKFSSDSLIQAGGVLSHGFMVLLSGRVELSFSPKTEFNTVRRRKVMAPGSLIGWGMNFDEFLPSPYGIHALEDCEIAIINQQGFINLAVKDPKLVSALYHKQLWIVGRFLRTAAALSDIVSTSDAINVVASLVADNRFHLKASSSLFAATDMLASNKTRSYGFDLLTKGLSSDDAVERFVSSLALDTLAELSREHAFSSALSAAHDRLLASEKQQIQALKDHSNDLALAFDGLNYQITGEENIDPDRPCIFILNSLTVSDAARLRNGLWCDLCSEFVASKISMRLAGKPALLIGSVKSKYQDFVQKRGIMNSQAASDQAASELADHCRARLEQGFNLMIQPEGQDQDYSRSTALSPGPMKPGALVLAQDIGEAVQIVPVVLANFDQRPADTQLKAKILPPLSSDWMSGADSIEAKRSLMVELRGVMREHIKALM